MIIASENVWLFLDALIPGRSTVYCSIWLGEVSSGLGGRFVLRVCEDIFSSRRL
jgi:hypothetical protein